jgi:hypothetical protein
MAMIWILCLFQIVLLDVKGLSCELKKFERVLNYIASNFIENLRSKV